MNSPRLLSLSPRRALGVLFILAVAGGCPETKSAVEKADSAKSKPPLVLLVVDDPKLGDAVAQEWRARTEEELVIRNASTADVEKASRLPGDAIIFPGGLIGSVAERGLVVPIDSASLENPDFNYRDIFDLIRLREMKWGDKTFAAPLGSPQLLLAYRFDILEKLNIAPPKAWAEYQQALEKLSDRGALGDSAMPADQAWHAAVEPLADGWAGQLLLARSAAYALHRDQVSPLFRFETMAPLIDQAPYRRALEELVAAAKATGSTDKRVTPQDAFAELRAGRCAMALTWASAAMDNSATQPADTKIRFAMLPGAAEAYRFATKSWDKRSDEESVHVPLLSIFGRLAAISATTAEPRRAESLVLWLAGSDVSQQIAPHSSSTALFRQSQVANSGRWTSGLPAEASRQYAETLAQTLNSSRSYPGLTIPGREKYLAALDHAVRQALDGKSAGESLTAAAKTWAEITAELDAEKQRRANALSLGQVPP